MTTQGTPTMSGVRRTSPRALLYMRHRASATIWHIRRRIVGDTAEMACGVAWTVRSTERSEDKPRASELCSACDMNTIADNIRGGRSA